MSPSLLSGSNTLPQNGSPDRRKNFEALYERSSRELWATAYAICMDSGIALQCMQQAFTELWERRDCDDEAAARTWLRSRVRTLAQQPNTPDATTTATAEDDGEFAAVRRLLKEVPDGAREMLTLRYALDYTAERIASVLAYDVSEVEETLAQAKARFGTLLPRTEEAA